MDLGDIQDIVAIGFKREKRMFSPLKRVVEGSMNAKF
jgi:hypothetical protein